MGRVGLGPVLAHLDRCGIGDVIDRGGIGGDLHVEAERARGARSLLAERPGKGARRGVVGGAVGRALDVANALGQRIGHRHVGCPRGAPVVDAVVGPVNGVGEGIAHTHGLTVHIDLGARGVRLGDGLCVVVRREGVGESLLAPLVGDLGLKAGASLSHCDVEGVDMRIVLNQDIAACFLGHGRVVGTRIGEAELAKGNLAILVILRLDRVALEHNARAVGEGELKGELPLLEAGLAAAREHLGELGDGRRGGGGVEGVGEGGGGDLVCRDGAIGLGSLGSVHRGLVAIGGTFGHRVGGSRGQPRDPRRLAIFEPEGRLAVLERRVTVGAGHAVARGIGGLDRKLKCLVRIDRQALARHDGLGDVELARLHGVGERDGRAVLGHGAFGLGAVSPVDRSRVALGGVLGHGVVRAHGQAGDGLLPAVPEREGRLAARERHGVLALAEGAGDGLAVPVGQRDREAELALAVAADDRLLDGEAAGLGGVGKDRRLDRALSSVARIVGQLCNLGLGKQLTGAIVGHRDGGTIGGLREDERRLVTRRLGNHIGIGTGLGVLDGTEVADLGILVQLNRRHALLGALGHGCLTLGSQHHGKGIRLSPVATGDLLLNLKSVLHLCGLHAVDVSEAHLRRLSDGTLLGVRLIDNRKAVLARHELTLGVELLHLVVRTYGQGNRDGAAGLKRDGVTALDLSAYISAVGAIGATGVRKGAGQRRCAIGLVEQHLKGKCLVGRGDAFGGRDRLAQRQAPVRNLIGGGVGLDGRVVADRHRRLIGDVARSATALKRVLGHANLKLNRALLACGNVLQRPGKVAVIALGAGILMVAGELHELGSRGNGIGDRYRGRRALGVLVADGVGEFVAQRHARPIRILDIALGLLGYEVRRGAGITLALVADLNGGSIVDGANSALGTLHGVLGNLDVHAHRTVAARRLLTQVPGEQLTARGALIGILALKGLEHDARGQLVGHGHVGRNQITGGVGLGIGPVDGIGVGVAHRKQLPVDVHIGLRDRANRLDLITRVVEDDLTLLGTIAIGHLGRQIAVVVVGHLEQHSARRRRIHGTHTLGQVGHALLCHQVKAVGGGVVGIVTLGGNAIVDGAGEVNRLLMSSAGSIAKLKVNLTKVDRSGTVLVRPSRALIHLFERAVGLLGIQVKRILASLDLVAGVHHLLGSKTVECSGRSVAVGKEHLSLGGTALGAEDLFLVGLFSFIGVIVLGRGHGIERTIAAIINRNLYHPIGGVVCIAALAAAILDNLVSKRLTRIFRRKGQATQNAGMGRAIGLRLIVCHGELALICAQQLVELIGRGGVFARYRKAKHAGMQVVPVERLDDLQTALELVARRGAIPIGEDEAFRAGRAIGAGHKLAALIGCGNGQGIDVRVIRPLAEAAIRGQLVNSKLIRARLVKGELREVELIVLPVLEGRRRLLLLSVAVLRAHRRAGDELAIDGSLSSIVSRGHSKGELARSIGTGNHLRHGRGVGCRLGDRIGVLEFDRRDTGGRCTRRIDPLALELVLAIDLLAYRCRDSKRTVAVIRYDGPNRMDRLVVRIARRLVVNLTHRIGERLAGIILSEGQPTRRYQTHGLGGVGLDICGLKDFAVRGNANLAGRCLVSRLDDITERALRRAKNGRILGIRQRLLDLQTASGAIVEACRVTVHKRDSRRRSAGLTCIVLLHVSIRILLELDDLFVRQRARVGTVAQQFRHTRALEHGRHGVELSGVVLAC